MSAALPSLPVLRPATVAPCPFGVRGRGTTAPVTAAVAAATIGSHALRGLSGSQCIVHSIGTSRVGATATAALASSFRAKGDYGFNVFHNSNPQHGGSYARHERRMRDDEVEDFLKSVKGWTSVREVPPEGAAQDADQDVDLPPEPSPLRMGEEAIQRSFHFDSFSDAYMFMGRLWAFCYGCDKYPPVTWDGCDVTVYLYSPSFHGLSRREARVAAFLNDQYNMLKKSLWQQEKILSGVVRTATIAETLGREASKALAEREAARRAPLREASPEGRVGWEALLCKKIKARTDAPPE